MEKVLVAYCTRFGASEGVAEEIAKVVRDHGPAVDLVNLKEQKKVDVSQYDGFVVGSSIKIGRWTKEAKNFLKKNGERMRGKPLALFVCCGDAIEEEKKEEARKKYVQVLIEDLNLEVTLFEVFPGIFDFSTGSRMGWLEKKMMKAATKDDPEFAAKVDTDKMNDFRDWDEIRAFALSFVQS